MGVRTFYLVMSQTGTWLSRVIKVYTKEDYNHISISLKNALNPMYSFGRINPTNPFSAGFVLEDINDGVFRIFPKCRCVVYKLEISNKQYSRLKAVIKEFELNKHKYRYNLLGLIYVAFNLDRKRRDHYFCSQFVAEVIQRSGIYDFKKPSNLITVKDFAQIPNISLVFEGFTQNVYRWQTV